MLCAWLTTIDNRIYIRGEFTWKKCETDILLYCFHTAGVLHIFMLYNLWALEYHFIENLKLMLKENQIILHIVCENLHDLYTLNSLSSWKGLKNFIPSDSLNSPLIYSILYGCNLNWSTIMIRVFPRKINTPVFQRTSDLRF